MGNDRRAAQQAGRHCHKGSVFLLACMNSMRERRKIEKIHVLLISDDSTCLKQLTGFLQAQPGFRITVVLNREEARQTAKQHPDVILLNVSLIPPLYAGLDLAIKSQENFDDLVKEVLLIIVNAWEIIYEKWSVCFNYFDAVKLSEKYNIQKGIGVYSLHILIGEIIENNGRGRTDQIIDEFRKIINKSEVTTDDWRIGGKFSVFNSKAGFQLIADHIKNMRSLG
ncbi:hypothetical protein SAMN02799630_03333 [Paenibacillus sp. UNCCL117]|uniref:response regulator transcription factor n=1 Tax=unclassified Paenibacillus TaxID=185978 RepID=UPI00087FB3F1|nr:MULTISPECIES: response regulator transcription factor [unclassified Paenibacillus]SDE42957.1 hypothetical protein SAMN04488602_1285 [Paenibacillus sp. cl123]SFW45874.1 hypothetical protein SAMN02799630_03333 [Paenibacillus sp. UNCCL117]